MRLKVGRVDHDYFRFGVLPDQFHPDAAKYSHLAPTEPMIVKSLVGATARWRIPPPQPIAIKQIMPLNTRLSSTRETPCDEGKNGFNRSICPPFNQNRSLMRHLREAESESVKQEGNKRINEFWAYGLTDLPCVYDLAQISGTYQLNSMPCEWSDQ